MNKKNTTSDIRLLSFSNYVRPAIVENKMKDWVLNGRNNYFFQYVIDRYNGSPTNAAIINSYTDLIYGRGLIATNASENIIDYTKLKQALSENDLMRIVSDFELFGEATVQIIQTRSGDLSSIKHVAKQNVAPQLADENGVVNGYWYCTNWNKQNQNTPEYFEAFDGSKKGTTFYNILPYRAGKTYFSDPDYLAGLPYAEAEEEISNYYVSHIQNGLSFGYIINIPNGNSLSNEQKDNLEKQIKSKLTGSSNAGKFVLSFNGVDAEITVTNIEVADAHKQWEFLTEEAKKQISTAHRLTSTSLVGLSTASGFSSTADEMDMAEEQLMKRVIQPKQRFILDALENILTQFNINLQLAFKPLTEPKETVIETAMTLSSEKKNDAEDLIALGEIINEDEWQIIDDRKCDEINITESQLNNVLSLASVPKTSNKKDVQDTNMFKVRYRYAGNPVGQRDFCNKVIQANKVYRSEDLNANYNYNEELAPKGKDSYNIFLYKGGVNCKHWWERVIYLKSNNERISVNEARRLINALDPEDRAEERLTQNPKEVAQTASASNNYWSLKPNYRN